MQPIPFLAGSPAAARSLRLPSLVLGLLQVRVGTGLFRRASPHEHLLRENAWTEVGRGARRVCYRVGNTGFCVKFLRNPAPQADGEGLGWRRRWSLLRARFDRFRNLNYREAGAMEPCRRTAGPAVVETVYDEHRGYGVLMSLLANADGTPVRNAAAEMARRANVEFSADCRRQTQGLLGNLAACSPPFLEPDFRAQTMADGGVRIRIVGFGPSGVKRVHPGRRGTSAEDRL